MMRADDALQDARRALREQRHPTSNAGLLLGDFALEWLDTLRLENSTLVGYRKIVRNHLVPYLGQIPVQRLTATRIARHYRELLESGFRDGRGERVPERGLSASSVNKVHVVLGAMLDAAIDDGVIAMNPARKSRTVQAPTGKQVRAGAPEIVTLSATQLRRFLDWDRDELQDELHALWTCLAMTGMRRGEVLALRWSDIDLEGQRISVRRAADYTTRGGLKSTKTGQSRVLDIDATLAGVLRRHRALRGALSLTLVQASAYVFADLDGAMLDPKNVTARWSTRIARARRAPALADLPHVTIKGLRHTHATLLLELGVHPKVVQERLGHSNISTTMNIYSHVTPTMQRDAVDRLHSMLS
ncbi:MAG: site-specific integrase [Actinobacteria bacterium]|nr:site-specific integrase [Actinomycetota bacterium]MBU1608931.1 site-specific integrase [Actinomycetota bacterium]MBU2316372.1 site-specific integrase [Actinomycetota bacterium]MBU2384062.1 site-specific integrase [Actinomycetota bacterium]